jgi:hypothetical protein
MPNNYKKKKTRSKKGGTTIRSISPNRSRSRNRSRRASRSPISPVSNSRSPRSPIFPIEPTPLVRQNAERLSNSPPRLVRQNATYNLGLNTNNSSSPRLVRQNATYNLGLNTGRQFSENRYVIANHNDTGNNSVEHHAERFMRNLIIDNLYRINNTNHRNETTYGFRMVNNEPVRIMQNVNTGALRDDYLFFVRRNSPLR